MFSITYLFFKLNCFYSKQDKSKDNVCTVVNLSDYVLKTDEINILAKGLNFIPTENRVNVRHIESDLDNLIRNVKLKNYFAKSNKPFDSSKKQFTLPSNFIPPDEKLSTDTVELITNLRNSTNEVIAQFQQDANSNLITYAPLNMTKNEYKALHELSKNHSLIIKSADKGGAVVVQNKNDYIFEANRQLADVNYYKPIPKSLVPDNTEKLTKVLKKMYAEKYITKKQLDFLAPSANSRERHFYILPKIHKPKESWIAPDGANPGGLIPPGRPIISDCSSESSNICTYLDSFFKPLSNKHPSYIKDTGDFISKIQNKIIPKDVLLFTGDVTSLYTNMDLERTTAVVRQQLRRNPVEGRPDQHILDLLNIIIKNNNFEFNGKLFFTNKRNSNGEMLFAIFSKSILIRF